jgi:hypothetical protein
MDHESRELELAWEQDKPRWALIVIAEALRSIAQDLHAIRVILSPKFPVTGIITQGDSMLTGTIKGLALGAADQFFCTPVDVNGVADQLPAGSPLPVFTADDPGVVISAPTVADATGNSCTATAPTGATVGGSFTLTWTGTFTAPGATTPTVITATAKVPYVAPPALNPVGGVISQGAPAK